MIRTTLALTLLASFLAVITCASLASSTHKRQKRARMRSTTLPTLSPPPTPFSTRNRPAISAPVVGGKPAPEAIRKRHATLYIYHADTQDQFVCGASILSRTHVLTAAHCVFHPGTHKFATGISVYLQDRIRFSSDPIPAAEVFVRADYHAEPVGDVDVYTNDVAVVRLASEFSSPDFKSIVLARTSDGADHPQPGGVVFGVGFGQTSFNGPLATQLLFVKLRLQTFERCAEVEAEDFVPLLNDNTSLCATDPGFPTRGGRDTCNGDSGGALYWMAPNGDGSQLVQFGITSWASTGCAGAGTVAWYTRVERYADDVMKLVRGEAGAEGDNDGHGLDVSIWKRFP